MGHFRGGALWVEARNNLRLAGPLILAQLTFVGMGTVDTVMAGRLGAAELAAVAVGANLWFMGFVLGAGLFMGAAPIVAQRVGANHAAGDIGGFVRATLAFAVLVGAAWTVLLWGVTGPVVAWLALDPATAMMATAYLDRVAWGAVPYALFFALRNAAEGFGETRPTLVAGLAGFCVNALGDWVLMYGHWGFPALGPEGCGIATALGGLTMALVYAALFLGHPRLALLRVWRRGRPRAGDGLVELVRIGVPIAVILGAEAWLFLGSALVMARFGDAAVAAHQVAFNFAALVFMVPMSIGLATTVRVGRAVGAGDRDGVRLRAAAGIVLGLAVAMAAATVMTLLPHWIVGVYTSAAGLTPLAIRFLQLAALFQFFDGVQVTANGALRGLKDTRLPMVITVAAYWGVGFPVATGLAFGTSLGPLGVWCGFIVALAVAAAGLGGRLWRLVRA